MRVDLVPRIIKNRGILSFEGRGFMTSAAIAVKGRFEYPPDYHVVHHEMGVMSPVLDRIRNIRDMYQDKVMLKRPPRR